MSKSICKTLFPCLDSFITRLQTEDISYMYPCNWNLCPKSWVSYCHSSTNITVNELENIKKEIEAIKKFNGFNINPLCNTDDNSTNIIDEDIKESIVILKSDLQKCNAKLDEIELNIKNNNDSFCIVETN